MKFQPLFLLILAGDDFVSEGERMIMIPALSTDVFCTNFSTLTDNEIEGNEDFDVEIDRVRLFENIQSVDVKQPTIGPQSSTTIVISDVPPESRSCRIDTMSQTISTFGDSNSYSYNNTCEHILLIQQSTVGEFGVFIESLDGTPMTTRVGVRVGSSESVVINVYNRTVIRQTTMNLIQVTSTPSRLTVAVPSLDFFLDINSQRMTLFVGADSSLQTHTGLCGNVNGDLVFRNGTSVDPLDAAAFNRLVRQNMVPPSETFIRMVTRQECGM